MRRSYRLSNSVNFLGVQAEHHHLPLAQEVLADAPTAAAIRPFAILLESYRHGTDRRHPPDRENRPARLSVKPPIPSNVRTRTTGHCDSGSPSRHLFARCTPR